MSFPDTPGVHFIKVKHHFWCFKRQFCQFKRLSVLTTNSGIMKLEIENTGILHLNVSIWAFKRRRLVFMKSTPDKGYMTWQSSPIAISLAFFVVFCEIINIVEKFQYFVMLFLVFCHVRCNFWSTYLWINWCNCFNHFFCSV